MRRLQKYLVFFFLFLSCIEATPLPAADNLCYLCHSVKFLKANQTPCKAWERHSHPTGVLPSPRVRVPKELPLDKNGKVTCSTCHQTFSDIDKKLEEDTLEEYSGRIYLRTKNDNSSMCISCHSVQLETTIDSKTSSFLMIMDTKFIPQKQLKKKGVKISFNHPVGIPMKTRLPKIIYESGAKFGTRKEIIICETCHKMHDASDRGLLILSNNQSLLCGVCHARSYARNRKEASRKSTHPVNIIPGRTIIPESILQLGGSLGKNGEIQCRTCHRAHRAATQKTLLIKENKQSDFCFECHQLIKEDIEETKHDLARNFPRLTNKKGQTAQESGLCKVCHLAHRGTGSVMWARPISQGKEPISDLCETCHQPGKCAENKTVGKRTHPVGVRIASRYTATLSGKRLPLFTDDGVRQNDANVTCATCHNVHKWNPETREKTFDKTVDGDNTNSFLREANSGSRLCTTCHRKKGAIRNTPHDPTLEVYQKEKTPPFNVIKSSLPSPNEPGVCDQCHSPHNATEIFLWNRKVGKGPDRISRICSGCHQKRYIAGKKLTGKFTHPINLAIDTINRFLRIPLPLYNRNFRKDPEGVILCSTCHDIHQWNPENQNAKNPRFIDGNGKNSFLRMSSVSNDRDLCTTCHLKKQWVKKTKHDLSLSAPKEKNMHQRTVAESGPCSSCHGVHNAISDFVLWGKELGEGGDRITRICNGCHSEGKSAGNKKIGRFSHPVAVSSFSVLKSLKDTSLKIYNNDYKAISPEEEKVPQLFIKNKTSPEKIDSIKKYYRMLFIRLYNLRKELPESSGHIREILSSINIEVEKINQINENNDQLKKEVEETEILFKRIEFNINVLEMKSKLGVRKTKSFVKKDSIDSKLQSNREAYKEEKQRLYSLYKEKKAGKNKLSAALGKLHKLKLKAVKLKKKYIGRAEAFKTVRNRVQQLIRKLRGRDKKTFDQLETNSKDALKNERKTLSSMNKKEILVHYSEFRNKYFELLNHIKQIKDKMEAEENKRRENEKKIVSHLNKKEALRKAILRRKRKSLKAILAAKREKFERNYRKLDMDFQIASKYEESQEFYSDSEYEFQGKIYCNTCHDVHQWDPNIKDVGPGKLTEGNNSNSFLRIANHEGSQLCQECHKEKSLVKDTDHDLRISAPDSKNNFNQTPSTSGLCGPCHATHNASRRSKLWARNVDKKAKHTDLISMYCASCHTKGNCAENKPFGKNSHPLGVSIKSLKEWKDSADFLKKKEETNNDPAYEDMEIKQVSVLPLYSQRGYRDDQDGKIYCSTCHNVHQWDPSSQHPGPGVLMEGNSSNSFLRETNNADSVLCTKCHLRQKWVIGTDHDMRISAPDFKNYQQKLTTETGVCSACHVVHNATTPFKLWALKPGPSNTGYWNRKLALKNNFQVKLCTSCHAAKGAIPQNLPVSGLHNEEISILQKIVSEFLPRPKYPYFDYSYLGPVQKLGISEIYRNQAEPKFTLYSTEGKPSLEGNIVCPTCHTPHIWSANKEQPGKKQRGTLSSSFLRPGVAKDFCSDCHGVDSIYLYSFFHSPRTARQKKATFSKKTPHKRDSGKVSVSIKNCHKCHQDEEPKYNKHPINITVLDSEGKEKKGFQKPDNYKDVPLTKKGMIVCATCHNPSANRMNKTFNPNFLRGDFYTANWQKNYKSRLLSNIRGKGKLNSSSSFSHSLGSSYAPTAEINNMLKQQGRQEKKTQGRTRRKFLNKPVKKPKKKPGTSRRRRTSGQQPKINRPRPTGKPTTSQKMKPKNPDRPPRFKSQPKSRKSRPRTQEKKTPQNALSPLFKENHSYLKALFHELLRKAAETGRELLDFLSPAFPDPPDYGIGSDMNGQSIGFFRSFEANNGNYLTRFIHKLEFLLPDSILEAVSSQRPRKICRQEEIERNLIKSFVFQLNNDSHFMMPELFGLINITGKINRFTALLKDLFSLAGQPSLRTRSYPDSWRSKSIPKPLNLNKKRKKRKRPKARSSRSKFSTPYTANYRKRKAKRTKKPASGTPAEKRKKAAGASKTKEKTEPSGKTAKKDEKKKKVTKRKRKRIKIKDESLNMGMGGFSLKTGRMSTVIKDEGEQAGPRRNMIPKIDEEMLKLRRKRWMARKKFKKENKKFKKRKKGYFISGVITKWSSSRTEKLGPNRYSLCYECHLIEEYLQFSPHKQQINTDYTVNEEICLYCHTKIPKRDSIEEIDFMLRIKIEKQCLSCHMGLDMYHPGGIQHYGQKISKKIRKRIDNLLSQGTIYLPTKSNRLVCPSCHNPHEKGVNTHKLSKRGADERGRLRLFGYEVCNACHKDSLSPGGQAGSPF